MFKNNFCFYGVQGRRLLCNPLPCQNAYVFLFLKCVVTLLPCFFLYTIYRVGSLAENEDMQGADMITVDTAG